LKTDPLDYNNCKISWKMERNNKMCLVFQQAYL